MSRSDEGLWLDAKAKINLALHVTGRRDDGFHHLDSLVVFAQTADRLHLRPAKKTSLKISGPFEKGLSRDNNLILLAFKQLSTALSEPIPATAFHLEKNLPVSSGIGGGSADAGAALNGLIKLWQIGISSEKLARIGLELGADVPVCLGSKTCRMQGIGEIIEPVKQFPAFNCVLVNPGIGVSTPEIFNKLALPKGKSAFAPLTGMPETDWLDWLAKNRNDLQAPAIEETPEIQAVIAALENTKGCQLARMSGSGATCFAIYDSPEHAEDAAVDIGVLHPDWWTVATRMGG